MANKKPTMADVAGPTTDARENYAQYKARMLESLRKNHAGQKTATTDLQPDGSYSGVSREIPIEDYFNYMLHYFHRSSLILIESFFSVRQFHLSLIDKNIFHWDMQKHSI